MFNPELEKELISTNTSGEPPIWITHDYRRVRINAMDDRHLINSLLKVKRDYPWRSEFYAWLLAEARKRGLV